MRLLQLANRLFVSILIRSGIDLKQQVAFVDNVAFLKRNIHNVTADPRRYVHELDSCGSASEPVPIYYLFLLRFAHRDFRGWWALRNQLLVVAAHEPKTQRDNGVVACAESSSRMVLWVFITIYSFFCRLAVSSNRDGSVITCDRLSVFLRRVRR